MEPLRVNARLVIPPKELQVSFARSGGPGGQHVNKVETRVELRFDVARSEVLGDVRRSWLLERLQSRLTASGELVIRSSRTRERGRNLEDARERLAGIVREALQRPTPRKATRPTQGSQRRRLDAKRQRSQIKKWRRADE
jgi:ribosome-associated protein